MQSPRQQQNGWDQWGNHILIEISRLHEEVQKGAAERGRLESEIRLLKQKVALYAAGGAGVMGAAGEAIRMLMS